MNMVGAIKIIESPLATEEAYNFPLSKNRSKRLHKKLLNDMAHKLSADHALTWFREISTHIQKS